MQALAISRTVKKGAEGLQDRASQKLQKAKGSVVNGVRADLELHLAAAPLFVALAALVVDAVLPVIHSQAL